MALALLKSILALVGAVVLLQTGVSSPVVRVCGSWWLFSDDRGVVAPSLAAPWVLSCGVGCPLPPPCHPTSLPSHIPAAAHWASVYPWGAVLLMGQCPGMLGGESWTPPLPSRLLSASGGSVVLGLPIPCDTGTARAQHNAVLLTGVFLSTSGVRGGAHQWCLFCTIALATSCFTCDVVQNLPNKKGIKEPNPDPSRLRACAEIVGIYLSKT